MVSSLSPVMVPYVGGARGHFLLEPRTGHASVARLRQEASEEPSDGVAVTPPPKGTSIAEARPVGLSIAGVGGLASSKPSATAVVGPGGLAIARPVATAIAGVQINEAVLGGGDDASGYRLTHKQKQHHKKVDANPVQVVVAGTPLTRRVGQVQPLQSIQPLHQRVLVHPRLSLNPVGHASYAVLPGNVYYV